jgi:chaperonin GroES
MLSPLQDNVLLKPNKKEEKAEGSLIFRPDTAGQHRYQKATVMATGPGKFGPAGTFEEVKVKAGDTVLYDTNYAHELEETDGEVKLVICVEGCLIAKV